MANININLFSGEKIKIKLLDNPFIDDFVNQLQFMINTHKIVSHRNQYPQGLRNYDKQAVEQYTTQLIDNINQLNEMGLNFPTSVSDVYFTCDDSEFERERQLLNTIHRHFTTGHKTFSWNSEPVLTWQYNSEFTFKDPENPELFSKCVHNINDIVHEIETYLNNPRVTEYIEGKKESYNEFIVSFERNGEYAFDNNSTSYYKNIKEEHYQYHSDKLEHDVWLPLHQIQGKDYLRGYFDYDDPNEWDITHPILYSGSLALGDREIMLDSNILDYLRSYNIEPQPIHYGMPLGNIIEGKELVSNLGSFDPEVFKKYDVIESIEVI